MPLTISYETVTTASLHDAVTGAEIYRTPPRHSLAEAAQDAREWIDQAARDGRIDPADCDAILLAITPQSWP